MLCGPCNSDNEDKTSDKITGDHIVHLPILQQT